MTFSHTSSGCPHRRMISTFLFHFLLLTVFLLGCFPIFSIGSKFPFMIQVAHRHGARTPIVPDNQSYVCGWRGCGQLIPAGADMLHNLGKFIRSKYGSYFDFDTYNPNLHYSRSTDIPRTLQSADALLTGLFNASVTTSFLPVIHSHEFFNDKLLLVDALAGCQIPVDISLHDIYTALSKNVVSKYINTIDLVKMGNETHQIKLCTFSTDRTWGPAECAHVMWDIAASYNAAGTLANYPTLKKYWENDALRIIQTAFNTVKYAFNPEIAREAEVGSCGQNLAKQMIANMKEGYAGNISYQFMEYSAHDTTMMPLCATLGHNEMMLPPFGQMYLFEGRVEQSVDNQGTLYIKAYYGYPTQASGSDHAYGIKDFVLNCMSKDGKVYNTTGDCLLEDFERFVASSDPKSVCGLCYLDADALRAIHCDQVDTPPDPSGLCYHYRTLCPESGCPVGYYLDPTSLGCYYIGADVASKGSYSPTTLAIAIACSAVGGVVIGFVIAKLVTMKKTEAEAAAYRSI